MNIEEMRASWKENDDKRDEGNALPKDLVYYKNLSYGKDPKWNLFDIYTPNTELDKYPVILSIHGGGWFYGDKELYSFYTASLATRGFAVINMNYSLAPESKYPIQVKEIFDCLDYCIKNQKKYHLDMNNLFIVGDSAGAQLNYQVSTIISNSKYRELFDINFNPNFNLRAISLNCGVYSFGITPFGPINMIKNYLGDNWKEYKKTYNIKKYVTSSFPPTYLLSGTEDFLKLFFKPMFRFLKRNKIEVEGLIYESKGDVKCPHVFHVDMKNPIGKIANDNECEFFKKHIA